LVACLLCPALPASASSWDSYNAGVNAYAAQRYAEAEQLWLELARAELPRSLRQPVWFQVGNAQFRLGEPLAATAPEQAVELWRRSCAAYRSVLGLNSRHGDARHNLALVERQLATLTQQLGNQLRQQSEKASPDDAINQLRVAADYLREAQQLAPEDAAIRRDRTAAEQRLQQRLAERAQRAEQRGDQSAAQQNTWADEQAERAFREALADLEEAQRQDSDAARPEAARQPANPQTQQAAAAQERVEQKLADLLTRQGQREQRAGNEAAEHNPDAAMERYEAALEKFQAAQAAQPEHAAAQTGERQVRAAMEQLHMQEGRQDQAAGEQAAPNSPARAARELTSALSHFEAALELNPLNQEAETRAEAVRRQLPELLTRAGQAEQRAGEQAEAQSANDARARYEEAQTSFQGALELAPQHTPAQEGLEQVRARLERLRQQQQAQQAKPDPSRPTRDLQQLLGEVQESRRDDRQAERQRQAARNQPQPRKVYPDW
jgi:tetratricopeptide (TPR) repeat protein